MKVIYKNQSKESKNSDYCTAVEYPLGDEDINGAVIMLTGRYPDSGRVTNLECKELVYVLKGSGKIVVEGNEIELDEGDMVLIEPKERYYFDGNMEMFMPCTPSWYPEQHKQVEQ